MTKDENVLERVAPLVLCLSVLTLQALNGIDEITV